MKKLLITGLNGFVGRTVTQVLGSRKTDYNLDITIPGCTYDLTDRAQVANAIREARPDFVIHLAAQSFVPESFANPRATYDVNFYGTLNLLEALKSIGFTGRLLYVGSAEVYGLVDMADLPIKETRLLRPRNPYAVSKLAAEILCYQWSQTDNIDVVMARPFNHIGPGQSDRFVVSDFAKQIAEIKHGMRPPVVYVGDIEVTRDFTDVRDVVRAYLLLLKHGTSGVTYNVCSGAERNIGGVLNRLLEIGGVRADVVQDRHRLRPSEQKRLFGCYDKLNQCSGWNPEIVFETSLRDTLIDWEKKLING